MKCDYCGLRPYIGRQGSYNASRPDRKIDQDYLGNQLCDGCKGTYRVVRIQSMVRQGRTILEATQKLGRENYLLWSGLKEGKS
jgi:hypothetical protein